MVGVFSSLIRLWGAFLSVMRIIWGAFSSFIRFGGSSSAASCSDVASDGSCSSSYDDDNNQTKKYHVFLSFRGPDTRKKFASHLHHDLCKKGIETYIDDRLESGDYISPALLKAIESSKIAVIIFSENYASSAWCLDELLHIVNCNLIVIPIFYGVDPYHVRRHRGTYETALKKLQQRFRPNKLNAWREALENVANISGYHSDSEKYKSEAELVKEIIHDISKKLDSMSVCDDFHLPNLVGMNEHVAHIQAQLAIGSQDVRIIGIWGIGGIGKTTLAQTLYDRIKSQFEGKCFLLNISETLKNQGEYYLQHKVFSELLNEENPKLVWNKLRSMKVLLALDDVDNSHKQLQILETLEKGCFGPGSIIIVTTRNKQVFQNIGVDIFYEIPLLESEKGCELFQLNAFRNNSPTVEYEVLIRYFVSYAGGLPLALKVLASSLCNKSVKEWESALVKLQKFLHGDIDAVLRWSFDGLDPQQKDIFLDIACFFKGKPRIFVAIILEACDLCGADFDISILIDKSLISIHHQECIEKVEMHDLVQQMGWNISRQECIEEPGKRKRIFIADDVIHILEDDTGTPSIRGIALNTDHIKDVVQLKATCFSNMPNLKFLRILDPYPSPYSDPYPYSDPDHDPYPHLKFENKLNLPEGLNGLPKGLRYLEWERYSCKYLPSNLCLKYLVVLRMPHSLLERLWEGALPLYRLKKFNLDYSTNLIEFPNISKAPELEVINLQECESLCSISFGMEISHITMLNMRGCISIVEIPSSIERLGSLEILVLSGCRMLESIPESICKLKSLQHLLLMDCLKLEKFPKILEPMPHLWELDLTGTSIKELDTSIQNLVGLKQLHLSECEKLKFLPKSLPVCLETLDMEGCKSLESLLELPPRVSSLLANSCPSLETISILGGRPIWNKECEIKKYYNFLNCPKLEQSAFDNIMTITPPPTNLSCFPSGTCIPLQKFYFKWSGNKIPNWMKDKSNESWVRVELPQNCSKLDYHVFSICLVPSPSEASSNLFVDIKAVCTSKDGFDIRSYAIYNNVEVGSDLKFMHRCFAGLRSSDNTDEPTEVIFYFSAFMGHEKDVNKSVQIEKCEVHLLSPEDVNSQETTLRDDGFGKSQKLISLLLRLLNNF